MLLTLKLIAGGISLDRHGFFQITQKLFLRDRDKLLILRDRKSGYGDLPGGRMTEEEFFGDWLQSLRREIGEELGNEFHYEIEPEPFLVHRHRIIQGNHPCIIIGYKGIFQGGTIHMSEEHDFMNWVRIQEYNPQGFFAEYMLEAVKKYIERYA